MPTLYKQLKKLPWTAIPATSAVSAGRGRRARGAIKAVLVPAWTGFAGAAAVRSPLRGPAALKTGTPGSAAVVEGHLVAVGVGEREGAAERPVGGR
jgi:hypothetical protein